MATSSSLVAGDATSMLKLSPFVLYNIHNKLGILTSKQKHIYLPWYSWIYCYSFYYLFSQNSLMTVQISDTQMSLLNISIRIRSTIYMNQNVKAITLYHLNPYNNTSHIYDVVNPSYLVQFIFIALKGEGVEAIEIKTVGKSMSSTNLLYHLVQKNHLVYISPQNLCT